jgi:hypothetical protein
MGHVANPPADGSCRNCSWSALFLDVIIHRTSNSFPGLDQPSSHSFPLLWIWMQHSLCPPQMMRKLLLTFLLKRIWVCRKKNPKENKALFSLDPHWRGNVSINHRLQWHSPYYDQPEEQKNKKENKKRLNSTCHLAVYSSSHICHLALYSSGQALHTTLDFIT